MRLVIYLALTLTLGLLTMANWIEQPIPGYLNICEKRDANLTDCLKTSIETFQTALINGIPNIEESIEIPSFDPLEIGKLFTFNRNRHGLHIKAENIIVLGILKSNVTKVRVVKHGKIYHIDVIFPKLQTEGKCEIIGKINKMLINEQCSFVQTLHESSGKVKAHFSHASNGLTVQTDRIDVEINAGRGVTKLYNLDKGRRILDQYEFDNVINHNFNKMNKQLFRLVEYMLQYKLKEISNKLLGHFSYGQIFPLKF